MIWHVCFVSLTHLFEVRLFSFRPDYPKSYQHAHLSWTDNTHQRLLLESNSTNVYVERCYRRIEHLVARCVPMKHHFNEEYQCHPPNDDVSHSRSKRQADSKPKRSYLVFLTLAIAIPCFIIGIIVGIAFAAYFILKRQQQRRDEESPRQETKTHSPAFPLTSTHTAVRGKQDILSNALNRYRTVPHQPFQHKSPIQRVPVSSLPYTKASANVSKPLYGQTSVKQQYNSSKNATSQMTNHSRHGTRSKSC